MGIGARDGQGSSRSVELAEEEIEGLEHVVAAHAVDPRIHPDEERALRDRVRVAQLADDTMTHRATRRMPQEIAGEESSRLDLALLEPRRQVAPREGRGLAHGEHEPERRGFAARVHGRQHEELLVALHVLAQHAPVLASRGDEGWQLLELLDTDRGLEVERLQVVADVGVRVLVVEPERQGPELVAEPLAARVVLARLTPAVAAPVAERAGDPVQLPAGREDRAALAGTRGRLELVRAERADRAEIRGRARVHEERVLRPRGRRKVPLERGRLGPCREPEIERTPYEGADLSVVEDPARVVDVRLTGFEATGNPTLSSV